MFIMLGLEFEEALVKVAINSGRIKGVEPLNLLIVGNAGIGKTTLLELFRGTQGTFYFSDFDAAGLRKTIYFAEKHKLLNRRTHIIIPDLTRIFGRKQSTIANTLSFLTMIIEDGIVDSAVYGMRAEDTLKHQKGGKAVKLGLIAAITNEAYEYICSEIPLLKDTFLTRFMIRFINEYEPEVIDEVASQVADRATPILEQPIILLPYQKPDLLCFPKLGLKAFSPNKVNNMRDWRVLLDFLTTYDTLHSYQRSSNQLLIANQGKNRGENLHPTQYIYNKRGEQPEKPKLPPIDAEKPILPPSVVEAKTSIDDRYNKFGTSSNNVVNKAIVNTGARVKYAGTNDLDDLINLTKNQNINFGKTQLNLMAAINKVREVRNNGSKIVGDDKNGKES